MIRRPPRSTPLYSSQRQMCIRDRYELSRCFNGTTATVTQHFEQCFRRTSNEYHLLKDATPYVNPFLVQYLTAVIQYVAEWYSSTGKALVAFINSQSHHVSSRSRRTSTATTEGDQLAASTPSDMRCDLQKSGSNRWPWFSISVTLSSVVGFVLFLLYAIDARSAFSAATTAIRT